RWASRSTRSGSMIAAPMRARSASMSCSGTRLISVPLRERPVSSRHAPLRQPRARLGEVLAVLAPEQHGRPEQASLSAEKVALPLVLDEREQLLLRGPITDAALQLDGLAVVAAGQLSDAAQDGRLDAAHLGLFLVLLVSLIPLAVMEVHHTCPSRRGG